MHCATYSKPPVAWLCEPFPRSAARSLAHYRSWRRGGDSNPRTSCDVAGFQDRCNQPLCHLSNRSPRCPRLCEAVAGSAGDYTQPPLIAVDRAAPAAPLGPQLLAVIGSRRATACTAKIHCEIDCGSAITHEPARAVCGADVGSAVERRSTRCHHASVNTRPRS